MSIQPTTDLTIEESSPITSFVSQSPNSIYTLNEKVKGSDLVALCRQEGGGSEKCVEIKLAVTKCFAMMQKQGFFCALPLDPSLSFFECQRIEKIIEKVK